MNQLEGRLPARVGAARWLSVSAQTRRLAAALLTSLAACGSVARPGVDAGSGSDTGTMPAPQLVLAGCPAVQGERPAASSKAETPRLGKLVVGAATAGQPLPGTLQLAAQSTATTLIVQVNGQTQHLECAISSAELAANQVDLSRITVAASSGSGNYLVYFSVADPAGNIGGYVVGTVSLGAPGPIAVCGGAPLQVLGRAARAPTATFTALGGTVADYVVTPTQPLSIVSQSRLFVDTGNCGHLLLASEPTAAKPVGWDNYLLVEYRSAPGGAVSKAWFYGSPGANTNILGVRASQTVVRDKDATVAGDTLDPPVNSTGPFGYVAKTIDLMTQVPPASHSFELTIYALDYGGDGSTTDVWLLPQ